MRIISRRRPALIAAVTVSQEDILSDVKEHGNFVGYTDFAAKAKVVAIIKDNQRAEELSDGELGRSG